MVYKLLMKTGKQWEVIGLNFYSIKEAWEIARQESAGKPFLIIPEALTD